MKGDGKGDGIQAKVVMMSRRRRRKKGDVIGRGGDGWEGDLMGMDGTGRDWMGLGVRTEE